MCYLGTHFNNQQVPDFVYIVKSKHKGRCSKISNTQNLEYKMHDFNIKMQTVQFSTKVQIF